MRCVPTKSILLLVGNGISTFRQSMSIAKCYGRKNIRRTMNWYLMDCFLQFTKFVLVKKHRVYLLKDKRLSKNMEIGTWHHMECISEFSVALSLHTGCHILYKILYFFSFFDGRHLRETPKYFPSFQGWYLVQTRFPQAKALQHSDPKACVKWDLNLGGWGVNLPPNQLSYNS